LCLGRTSRLERCSGQRIMAYHEPQSDSLIHTVKQVIDDIRELFREEVALARAELRQEMSVLSGAAIQMAAGAIAGLFALFFLLTALALGIADLANWPAWAGYLVVAALLGVGAAVALQVGRRRVRSVSAVPQTVESLEETKEWLKHRIASERR